MKTNFTGFFYFFFLLYIPSLSYAQSHSKLDSLFNMLHATKSDSIQANIYLAISMEYKDHLMEYNKAEKYIDTALQLAQDKYLPTYITLLNKKIDLLRKANKFSEAILTAQKALELSERIQLEKGFFFANNQLAIIYVELGDYAKASSYFYKQLKRSEKNNNIREQASLSHNLGTLYMEMNKPQDALKFELRALKFRKKEKPKKIKLLVRVLLGIGKNYFALKKYDKALEHLQRGLNLAKEKKLLGLIKSFYTELGKVYYAKEKFNLSEEYFKKSLELAYKSGNKNGICISLEHLGYFYKEQNLYFQAENYLQKALVYADSTQPDNLRENVYGQLYELYRKKQDYYQALIALEKSTTLRDSLLNKDNLKQIENMRILYETEKKEEKIKNLAQKNEIQGLKIHQKNSWLLGLGIFSVLLVILGYLFIYQNRLRVRQKTMELEQKLLRTQMNPHFMFNALNAIQQYIYQNHVAKAGKYLAKFAKLMRQILENSRQEFIPLEKEINTLENYFEMQLLRLNNRFDYVIEIDPELEEEEVYIPPMFAQPFIENAVEHGILHKEGKGHIKVLFQKKSDSEIVLKVEDDGVGLQKSSLKTAPHKKDHVSLATQITRERLAIFYTKNIRSQMLRIQNITDHINQVKGTQIQIQIPYKYGH